MKWYKFNINSRLIKKDSEMGRGFLQWTSAEAWMWYRRCRELTLLYNVWKKRIKLIIYQFVVKKYKENRLQWIHSVVGQFIQNKNDSCDF